MNAEPPPEQRRLPLAEELSSAEDPDAWISALDELRRNYEAGMAYADRFARRFACTIYAESVRAYAMSSAEIEKVEALDEEERIAWMCVADAVPDGQSTLELFHEDAT